MRYVRISTIPFFAPTLIVFGLFAGSSALAGTQDGAVIALHVQAHATKSSLPCSAWEAVPCSQFRTSWPLFTPADVYLVVARGNTEWGDGIGGVACGINYNPNAGPSDGGLDIFSWRGCASVELTNPRDGEYDPWPSPGSGIWCVWATSTSCQRTTIGSDGVHAVAGSFYVYAYSPDILEVVPYENPVNGPELQVVDCWAYLTDLPTTAGGAVRFGGGLGYNPCTEMIPIAPTTWGTLKQKFVK
jgi:hypothetical protein